MGQLTESAAWRALEVHAESLKNAHLRDFFAASPDRFQALSRRQDDLLADFSKQRVTAQTLALVLGLARQADVPMWRDRMFAGERINSTGGPRGTAYSPAQSVPANRSCPAASMSCRASMPSSMRCGHSPNGSVRENGGVLLEKLSRMSSILASAGPTWVR